LVEKTGDTNNPVHKRSVPSAAYGQFLNTIFDEWMRNDIGKIFIQLFDESVRPFLGMEHALCIYRETCGDVPVVEHNGDFFLRHHVTRNNRLSTNVRWRSGRGRAATRFRPERNGPACRILPRVRVLSMCNGGCPAIASSKPRREEVLTTFVPDSGLLPAAVA
jgi:uncharacterized protein